MQPTSRKQIRVLLSRRNAFEEILDDKIALYWDLKSTEIAKKYFEALKIACETRYLYRRDRFINFRNAYYTENKIVEKLNSVINLINSYHPGLIPEHAYSQMDQNYMNHLHGYFEKHRGPMLHPGEIYVNGSVELQEAFDEFNIFIHRYEDVVCRKSNPGLYPTLHCNFGLNEVVKRYYLEDEDFDQFTFEKRFGTWVISYCEVGKPLHDIWRDKDSRIGQEVILPLKYYSADGVINFSKAIDAGQAQKFTETFYKWWDQNKEHIEKFGFRKFDKRNSLGNIPVAELNHDMGIAKNLTDAQILDIVSSYQWIDSVECIEG